MTITAEPIIGEANGLYLINNGSGSISLGKIIRFVNKFHNYYSFLWISVSADHKFIIRPSVVKAKKPTVTIEKSFDTYRVKAYFQGLYGNFYFIPLCCSNKYIFTAKNKKSSIVAYGSLAAANKQIATAPVAIETFEIMLCNNSFSKQIKAILAIPSPIINKKTAQCIPISKSGK